MAKEYALFDNVNLDKIWFYPCKAQNLAATLSVGATVGAVKAAGRVA